MFTCWSPEIQYSVPNELVYVGLQLIIIFIIN